jgi:hypothetical protein
MATVADAVKKAWDPWERTVTSWSSALAEIDNASLRADPKSLVWRGAVDASWAMQSSLSRHITRLAKADPTEKLMQEYEREILNRCRTSWRFDHLPTLELLAHLQHFGGPTRLIDVSRNPFVSLWFAVERQYGDDGKIRDECDGRLFAFSPSKRIRLSDKLSSNVWGGEALPWDGFTAADDGWGRHDEPPVLWIPPAYNERIAAQNAGFLIGGTPASWGGGNRWKAGPKRADGLLIGVVRQASSLYVRPSALDRNAPKKSYPNYTIRIKAEAKEEIRSRLEKLYGFSSSTIYPDLFGLANEVLKTKLDAL